MNQYISSNSRLHGFLFFIILIWFSIISMCHLLFTLVLNRYPVFATSKSFVISLCWILSNVYPTHSSNPYKHLHLHYSQLRTSILIRSIHIVLMVCWPSNKNCPLDFRAHFNRIIFHWVLLNLSHTINAMGHIWFDVSTILKMETKVSWSDSFSFNIIVLKLHFMHSILFRLNSKSCDSNWCVYMFDREKRNAKWIFWVLFDYRVIIIWGYCNL